MCLEVIATIIGSVHCSKVKPVNKRAEMMMRLLSRRFSSTRGCAFVPEGVLTAYGRLVNAGRLREDAGQASTVQTLQALQSNLKGPQATGVYLWGPVGSGKSVQLQMESSCR